MATLASVLVATALVVAKAAAWLATGSVSVLASLVDSLMDVGASGINLVAVRYALQPPDDEHRFGHGKAESLAGLAQACFVAGSAVFLLLHAVDRWRYPAPLESPEAGFAVILFAMLATTALLGFQRHVIRRTGSTAIRADATHYAADLATNAAVLLALYLASIGMPQFDPLFGLVIAVAIALAAGRVGLQAIQVLMDRELPEQQRAMLFAAASETPGVLAVHGMRTWRSGLVPVVQLHIELDPNMTLSAAHTIAVAVERRILEQLPGADVTIHQDPAGLDESHANPGDRFRA